jgi:hypothetical protein
VSHASFVVWPPTLTFSPPRPSAVADVAPQDTRDPLVASALLDTKPVTHALTRKAYVANQNKICPKAALEGIGDGSISSMPASYRDDHATHPIMDSMLDLPNSTIS